MTGPGLVAHDDDQLTVTVGEPAAGAPAPSAGDRPTGVSLMARWVVPFLMLGGVFVAVTRWAAQPLSNMDTYFHLRFGQEFLDGWSLRHPGSVTSYATADWVPTQWLPQMVMAEFENWFGLSGVAWLSGVQFLALAVALWFTARKVADPVVVAPLVILAFMGSVSGLSMRPQVISYVFVVLTFAAWRRVAERDWVAWPIVPLTWVWAMCHGMWPLGIVIGLGAVAGIALDRRARGRRLLVHLSVPVLSGIAAGLLTPVGPALLPAVLSVNSRAKYFYEWASPNFKTSQCLAVLVLLVIVLLPLARRGRADWFTLAMAGLGAGFLLYSLRTVPVAACLLMPLAAVELQRLVNQRNQVPVARVSGKEKLVVLGGAALSLAVLALMVPTTADEPPPQAAWVDQEMHALPAGTLVLDDTRNGGYLMWRYPDLDFIASGYGDIYTDAEIEALADMSDLKPHWDDLVRKAHPAYALVAPGDPLGYALQHTEGWTVVRGDSDLVLLKPPPGWMDQ